MERLDCDSSDDSEVTSRYKPKYVCRFCFKVFPNGSALGGHQNAHRLERSSINEVPISGRLYHRSGPLNHLSHGAGPIGGTDMWGLPSFETAAHNTRSTIESPPIPSILPHLFEVLQPSNTLSSIDDPNPQLSLSLGPNSGERLVPCIPEPKLQLGFNENGGGYIPMAPWGYLEIIKSDQANDQPPLYRPCNRLAMPGGVNNGQGSDSERTTTDPVFNVLSRKNDAEEATFSGRQASS